MTNIIQSSMQTFPLGKIGLNKTLIKKYVRDGFGIDHNGCRYYFVLDLEKKAMSRKAQVEALLSMLDLSHALLIFDDPFLDRESHVALNWILKKNGAIHDMEQRPLYIVEADPCGEIKWLLEYAVMFPLDVMGAFGDGNVFLKVSHDNYFLLVSRDSRFMCDLANKLLSLLDSKK